MKNTLKRGIFPLFIFVLLFLSTSCRQEIKPDMNLLSSQVRLFNRFLIWQKYADAEKMVSDKLISKIEDDSKLKRYTEINIIKIKPITPNKVKILLRREYYFLNNNTVKREIVEQLWEFKPDQKQWILISERPLS